MKENIFIIILVINIKNFVYKIGIYFIRVYREEDVF